VGKKNDSPEISSIYNNDSQILSYNVNNFEIFYVISSGILKNNGLYFLHIITQKKNKIIKYNSLN